MWVKFFFVDDSKSWWKHFQLHWLDCDLCGRDNRMSWQRACKVISINFVIILRLLAYRTPTPFSLRRNVFLWDLEGWTLVYRELEESKWKEKVSYIFLSFFEWSFLKAPKKAWFSYSKIFFFKKSLATSNQLSEWLSLNNMCDCMWEMKTRLIVLSTEG